MMVGVGRERMGKESEGWEGKGMYIVPEFPVRCEAAA